MDLKLLLFGFCIHVVFFYSLFDIYFTSPLVHGMRSHVNPSTPPAKRLVLFSADGLRADKLFEMDSGKSKTPYLRNIVENVGSWGVSHTRVPTESRPGHVAFIAGFYEDVSSITKGWKENPVEFDSVFNQSKHTWSWGSPDILPMFSKGASGNHVSIKTYPGHSEDFAGSDLTKLDSWVFDNVQEFFENVPDHKAAMLQQEGIIFFLHLLGLDTTGHVHKPHSKEYVRNLMVVDEGIKKMVGTVEEYFERDGFTSYVFTADHGMTDWGSHGAGDPSETQTPFVAWGAGINPPSPARARINDGLSEKWNLQNVERHDVNQADVCPFLSTLIGIPIPHQSVGVIPVGVLNASLHFKSTSLLTNLHQVYEQLQIKEADKRGVTFSWMFTPFKLQSQQEEDLSYIEQLISEGSYELAINASIPLISTILDGVQYYHKYDNNFLGASLVISFLGWIAFLILLVVESRSGVMKSPLSSAVPGQRSVNILKKFVRTCLPAFVVIFLAAQYKPAMYYVYCLLPVVMLHLVLNRYHVVWNICIYLGEQKLMRKLIVHVLLVVFSLEVMIFSFTHRQLISFGLVSMATWKVAQLLNARHTPSNNLGWIASCLFVSVHPFLPTIGSSSNYALAHLSVLIGLFVSSFCALRIFKNSKNFPRVDSDFKLHILQVLLIAVSGLILWGSVTQRGSESPSVPSICLHSLSWIILASSFILPLLCSTRIPPRLLSVAVAFYSPYLLLTTSHESLFFLSFCSLMAFWVELETDISFIQMMKMNFTNRRSIERKLNLADVRRSCFFIFFLLTSFFGTGNIASINSFDPTSVLCYISVFDPFTMGGLMLYKVVILFIIVSSCFHAIQISTGVPTNGFFLLVLIFSDFMALHFFFMVQDQGSWLEIGSSISHYVIVMTLILFLFLLLSVCRFLTEFSIKFRCLSKKRTE